MLTLALKARFLRSWRKLLIAALALLIAGVLGQATIGSILRVRMASRLRATWGIDLQASSAWYLPPRGLSLHGVRLTKLRTDGTRVEVFRAARVVVKGAHLPNAGQPLIVDRMEISSPVVTVEGRPKASLPPAAWAVVAVPVLATSKNFELHNLKVTNGRFAYELGGEPVVLDPINLTIAPSGRSKDAYSFALSADQASSKPIQASGLINVDWRLASYQADIHLESGKEMLPGSTVIMDRAEADVHVQGSCGAAGMQGMHVTLRKLAAVTGGTLFFVDGAEFQTTADGQSWQISGLRGRMDINGGVPAFDRIHLRGRFVFTAAASGPLKLPEGASAFTVVRHEILAYPRDVSVQPPRFPIAVAHISGGPISFRGGVVRFADLSGDYGGDRVLLDAAHITVDDPRQRTQVEDLRRQIRIEGIAGTLICHQPGPLYPAALGKTVAQLRPTGPFMVGGGSWYAINRQLPGEVAKPKPDFFFRVASAKGAFALTDRKGPLTSIRGQATVSPMMVDIKNLRGDFLGGTVIASGRVTPIRPVYYDGVVTFYNVNLDAARRQLALVGKMPVVGQMYLKSHVSGIGRGGGLTPIEAFAAEGEFDAVDGNFGDITALRAAAQKVTKPGQPLDGNAAGVFTIRNKVVTLQNCAVGNPLFGLQGSGTISFDKRLDLHVVAAPLGDWRLALKHSKVPGLEDVGSDIAAAIQGMFNGAQRVLLWDIHVGGTTAAPIVQVAPAPIITEPLAALFAEMIRGDKQGHLIDNVRAPKPKMAGAVK